MKKVYKKIQTDRLSFIITIVTTFVNAIVWVFGSTFIFQHTAFTPQPAALFSRMLDREYGVNVATGFWILLSLALIALNSYTWKSTKSKAKGFLLAPTIGEVLLVTSK